MPSAPIYLDYHAHAPIEPRALDRMIAAFTKVDANPHSTHLHGGIAHAAVEEARGHVAALIGCRGSEIVFTSGATEANNLALTGLSGHLQKLGRNRIAISAIEHASIMETVAALGRAGWGVDVVPVMPSGRLDLDALKRHVSKATGLVSVGWANHEIGVVQPMEEISRIVRAEGALLHSDLAQAAGKVPVSAGLLDMASLSAHKLGGPTGIGALLVSRRLRSRVEPTLRGGGQEGGARSGTISPPLCIGFGVASEIALTEMAQQSVRVSALRNRLRERLLAVPGVFENGDVEHKLPGNLNLCFEDVDGEALVLRVQQDVSLSTGSACSARTLEPSHVLLAIGLSRQQAETAIRIGLGHGTSAQDIEHAAGVIERAVKALRSTRRRA